MSCGGRSRGLIGIASEPTFDRCAGDQRSCAGFYGLDLTFLDELVHEALGHAAGSSAASYAVGDPILCDGFFHVLRPLITADCEWCLASSSRIRGQVQLLVQT